MHDLLLRLFPICRSLAGPGNCRTLDILRETVDMERLEIPSGAEIFDWTVPEEWTPRAAHITGPNGKIYADFAANNLHLVSHSEPVEVELDRDELLEHIYSLPDQPDLIPYVSRYYKRDWGFCMTEQQKRSLPEGRYKVLVDADLEPGNMSIGEAFLPGDSKREILISTYICHPSMANDNLSGVVTAAGLYSLMKGRGSRRLSYRFLFLPETIGSIAWLAANRKIVKTRTEACLVLSSIGNDAPFTYKASRNGATDLDRIATRAIAGRGVRVEFTPVTGSDERQFCSPGFDLPAGLLCRSYPGTFPFYHTSGDTPDRTPPHVLQESLEVLRAICLGVEANTIGYRRTDPYCEPMLSKRRLYNTVSIRKGVDFDRSKDPRTALMWVLNQCDGKTPLVAIAEKSELDILALADVAERAAEAGVLARFSRLKT